MRTFKIVAMLLTVTLLSVQAVRHIYVAYVEPRTSVLDKFNKTEAGKAVEEAKSLEELLVLYAPARKRFDELNQKLKEEKAALSGKEEREVFNDKFNEQHGKELAEFGTLSRAIEDWEHKNIQVTELRVFWAFGIGLFLVGAVLVAVRREWLGLSLMIPGVIEMLWWTSPSIRFDGCPVEFDRLLFNKIVFTLITLAVVIVAWLLNDRGRSTASPLDRS